MRSGSRLFPRKSPFLWARNGVSFLRECVHSRDPPEEEQGFLRTFDPRLGTSLRNLRVPLEEISPRTGLRSAHRSAGRPYPFYYLRSRALFEGTFRAAARQVSSPGAASRLGPEQPGNAFLPGQKRPDRFCPSGRSQSERDAMFSAGRTRRRGREAYSAGSAGDVLAEEREIDRTNRSDH